MDTETFDDMFRNMREATVGDAYTWGQDLGRLIVADALEQGRKAYPGNETWATSYALGVLEANIGFMLARMAQPEA